MKHLRVAAAMLLVAGCVHAAGPDEGLRLRNLERDLNRAIAQRDARRVSELLSDDWMLVTGSGKVKTKADVLTEIAEPELEFQDNESRDVLVRMWGDTAVLTGVLHQRYRLRGAVQDVTLRYTDTWTRVGDTWRQVSGHTSRLPD
jgi:ketosteroid isomerase-like protein